MRAVFLCAALVPLLAAGPDSDVIRIPAGGDLQQAIDRARPGSVLALAPGVTYVGNFVLPDIAGTQFITIRTFTNGTDLPAEGQRIAPGQAPLLAKLRSPNGDPVLRTAPGAHHWRLELLEILPTATHAGDIIALGDGSSGQNDRALVPHDLAIDRCYVHGDPVEGQKRGIALNSASTTITGSYISDIKTRGQDSQAIAGWNGPGPYRIENNYLEAAGDNFMLGGADPGIAGLMIENVVFRGNHVAKPASWRGEGWQVKNLFELKNGRHVLVEDNVMEYVWKDAQVGYAILLTPRNQEGRAPWNAVQDVTIRRNIIRHAGAGIQIVGPDANHPSGSASGITLSDNLFYDIDAGRWGGPGVFLLLGEGPGAVTIEHNTISQSGPIMQIYGGTSEQPKGAERFVFRNNLVRHNEYGVHGQGRGVGTDSIRAYLPGAVFEGNAIAGGDSARYPPANTFLQADRLDAEVIDAAAGDFRLKPSSRLKHAARDGRDVGADAGSLARARAALVTRPISRPSDSSGRMEGARPSRR